MYTVGLVTRNIEAFTERKLERYNLCVSALYYLVKLNYALDGGKLFDLSLDIVCEHILGWRQHMLQ